MCPIIIQLGQSSHSSVHLVHVVVVVRKVSDAETAVQASKARIEELEFQIAHVGHLHQKLALSRGLGGIKRESPAPDDDKRRLVVLPYRMTPADEAHNGARYVAPRSDGERQVCVRKLAEKAASVQSGRAVLQVVENMSFVRWGGRPSKI